MKKINLTFLVFIMFFMIQCSGYKPIFGSTNLKFKISNYYIENDKVLVNKLYSKLKNLSQTRKTDVNIKELDFIINVSKNKNPTTKDSAGKILEYRIDLITKIEIDDFITGEKILNKEFNSSLNYKVQSQYSDTIKMENQTVENLINKTQQEILINLSKNISE